MEFCIKLANYKVTIGNDEFLADKDGYNDLMPFERKDIPEGGYKGWEDYKNDKRRYERNSIANLGLATGGILGGSIGALVGNMPVAVGGAALGTLGAINAVRYDNKVSKPYGIEVVPSKKSIKSWGDSFSPEHDISPDTLKGSLTAMENLPISGGYSDFRGQRLKEESYSPVIGNDMIGKFVRKQKPKWV